VLRPLVITVGLVVARVLDFWTTYRVAPSLRGESNPVVWVLGAGWGGRVLCNGVLVVGLIGLAWCAGWVL
jgi:hypothetical protein